MTSDTERALNNINILREKLIIDTENWDLFLNIFATVSYNGLESKLSKSIIANNYKLLTPVKDFSLWINYLPNNVERICDDLFGRLLYSDPLINASAVREANRYIANSLGLGSVIIRTAPNSKSFTMDVLVSASLLKVLELWSQLISLIDYIFKTSSDINPEVIISLSIFRAEACIADKPLVRVRHSVIKDVQSSIKTLIKHGAKTNPNLWLPLSYLYKRLWWLKLGLESKDDSYGQNDLDLAIKYISKVTNSSYSISSPYGVNTALKLYAINNHLYYLTERDNPSDANIMRELAREMLKVYTGNNKESFWQYKYDDTLGRYYWCRYNWLKQDEIDLDKLKSEANQYLLMAQKYAKTANEEFPNGRDINAFYSLVLGNL